MFSQLLRFEVSYQLRQKALPIFALIFFCYGLLAGKQGFAPTNVNFNSDYQINFFTGLFSLGAVFVVIFFAVSGMLRDARYRMDQLIYGTAIKKHLFFWSRFLGVFLFSLLAFSPMLLGLITGYTITDLDPDRLSPFKFMSYLRPWLFTIVPNVFMCSTLIFAVSALTKNNLAIYLSSIFIYMLYMVSGIFLNSPLMAQSVPASPEAMAMAALTDPFGISAFYEQTQHWTPYQKNTQFLSFSGLYLWNRIIWMTISLGILLTTYRVFTFRKVNQKAKKADAQKKEKYLAKKYVPIAPASTKQSQRSVLFSLLKMELNGVFKSLPFVGVLIVWLFIVFMELNSRVNGGGAYGDSWYPFTNLLIELLVDPLTLLTLLPIIFYSGEIVWRERNYQFNGIIDATPVFNGSFFVSKLLALLMLPVLFITTGILICLVFQMGLGYFNFEFTQYLHLYYHYGMPLFIFGILAMFVQSMVPNKYLGMGITGVIILCCLFAPYLGIEHPLLRLAFFPRPTYSNMIGYSADIFQFNHLAVYWLAFGGMLSVMSFKLWQRGIISSIRDQALSVFRHWNKRERLAMITFTGVFLAMGAVIFHHTNVVKDYYTAAETLDLRERYERKYKTYESLDRLYPHSKMTHVDLFPSKQAYQVTGDYVLINKGKTPISQVFVSERIELSSITLEGAQLIEKDEEFGVYLFSFDQPIAPGQKVRFQFALTKETKGYEVDETIVSNGTYLTHNSFDPRLAYQGGMEISDPIERQKRGLPMQVREKTMDEHLFAEEANFGKINYETIISTEAAEMAIGTGSLIRQWKQNGRNYFHYKPEQVVMPTMSYISSAYEVKTEEHHGVQIEQYYHPDHTFNIEVIMESTQKALDYCITHYGDYSGPSIRMAEVPSHWPMGGFAHPGVISMVEDNLYLIDTRDMDDFNLVAKRTIHEVAHQWWGHIVAPKLVDGGSLFVEGFAKYTEAVVMEQMYGKEALWQLSENASRRYFPGRAFASEKEPPIYLESGQSYLAYGKSYHVMVSLRELIGEEKVNAILSQFVDRYRDQREFGAHTLEFLEEVYAMASPEQRPLIDDWFKRIITYDLAATEAAYTELDNGQYEVTVKVQAKRLETNEEGVEKSIDINEPLMIGLLSTHPSQVKNENDMVYLEPHTINKEEMTFKIVVDQLPKYVGIDPFGTRTDPNLHNNVIRL